MPWSSNKFQEILNILCEGFKTRSNFRGLKLHLNKRYAIQNLPIEKIYIHVYVYNLKIMIFIIQTKF